MLATTHVMDRYREAMVPALLPFAAFAAVKLAEDLRAWRTPALAATAVVATAIAWVTTLHFPNFDLQPDA